MQVPYSELPKPNKDALPAVYKTRILPMLENALKFFMNIYDFDAGSVYLPSQEKKCVYEIACSIGFSQEYVDDTFEIRSGVGFCGTAIDLDEVRLTEDVENDPRYVRPLIKKYKYKSFVALPIHSEIGLINLASMRVRQFTAKDLTLFSFVRKNLSCSAQREIELYQATGHVKLSKKLAVLNKELWKAENIQQLSNMVVEESRQILGTSSAMLFLQIGGESHVVMRGFTQNNLSRSLRNILSSFGEKRALYTVSTDISNEDLQKFLKDNQLLKLFCHNITGQNGWVGCFCIGNKDDVSDLSENQMYALARIHTQISTAINRIDYQKQQTSLAILEEHARISRETHDFMAQEIVSIQRSIEYLRMTVPDSEKERLEPEYDEILDMIHALYDDTRELIAGLRVYESMDTFENTVRRYLNYFQAHSEVPLQYTIGRLSHVPEMAQVQFLRIIQEALANVRKHSKACNVSVSVKERDHMVCAEISDDGIGFSINDQLHNNEVGYGLHIMSERAESVNGTCQILSEPGNGTTVLISIPFDSQEVSDE